MRKLFLLLALSGCDSRSEQPTPLASGPNAGPMNAIAAGAAAGSEQLEERARASLRAILLDPDSMRFASLRAGTSNALCGEVEAKQADGGREVRPFVVTPEGVAVVSPTTDIRIDDPEDPFPDFHMRWCASPAELARMQSRMIGGETLGLGAAPPPSDIPDVPTDLTPDLLPVPEPERPAAQVQAGPPPRPPAPTSDDSFFNAIARPAGKDGR